MSIVAIHQGERSLGIARDFDVSIGALWRCWTEPELLKRWYCPAPWRVTRADLDARPGGRFDLSMEGPEGEAIDTVGSYLAVEPHSRLVFSDAYGADWDPRPESFMTGVVHFEAAPGGARMTWTARHATAEARDAHLAMGFEQGWPAAAEQLAGIAKEVV